MRIEVYDFRHASYAGYDQIRYWEEMDWFS